MTLIVVILSMIQGHAAELSFVDFLDAYVRADM